MDEPAAIPDLSGVRLRSYAADDLSAVRALHRLSFARLATPRYAPAQVAAHDALIDTEDYAADLARSHLQVAELPGLRIVGTAGWVALAEEPGTARIRKLFVSPAVARRGLATRLLSQAEGAAKAAGHSHFLLRAYLNAVPFYEAQGYRADQPGVMALADGLEMPVLFMSK
ncbi:MAG TPA: GNAT family N-acetyltransferase [Alphaproteobacteria bacterium]|jgi:putative acetyltransferase